MVPCTFGTHLDHVRRELAASLAERLQLGLLGDATAMRRKAWTEDVGDVDELGVPADGADLAGLLRRFPGGAYEFGMGVAHLMPSEVAFAVLRDDVLARQPVVDLTGRAGLRSLQGSRSEAHGPRA